MEKQSINPAVSFEELEWLQRKLRSDEETSRSLVLQLVSLRNDIFITRSKINQYQNALQKSYISILPSDILLLIFSNLTCDTCLRFPRQLLELSHVCKQWREVTISTPALWAKNLCLTYRYSIPLFQLFIDRAKQCPLSVEFNERTWDDVAAYLISDRSGHNLAQNRAMDLLVSFMGRCRNLELRIRDRSSKCIARLAEMSAPCLETLVVNISDVGDGSQIQILNGGTPRLSSLTLVSVPPQSIWIGSGLNALTHLTITIPGLDPRALLDLLSKLPLLRTLQLHARIRSPAFNMMAPTPVELNHLSVLETWLDMGTARHCDWTKVHYTSILSLIQAPLLRHLVLLIFPMSEFPETFEHYPLAFPMLRKLKVKLGPYGRGHETFLNLFPVCPRITHLEVDNSNNSAVTCETDNFTVPRIIKTLGTEVWPMLKQFTLFHIDAANVDTLIKFVRERKKAGSPLDGITLFRGSRTVVPPLDQWFHKSLQDVYGLVRLSDLLDLGCLSTVETETEMEY